MFSSPLAAAYPRKAPARQRIIGGSAAPGVACTKSQSDPAKMDPDIRNVVEEAELQRHCGDLLSDYKVPEMFHRLEGTLPRNANGKVLKRSLREILVA
jgi:acyl-CoA synthetase (AMP-forming)/AMP-acid ligase II